MTENVPSALNIRVIADKQSDPGRKRPNNEDFTAFYMPNDPAELEYSGCLYVVADGVGGSYKGEKASKYAVEKVLYEYYRDPQTPPAERLCAIIRGVGNDLHKYSVDNGTGRMASTLVAAVIRGSRLMVANVGDSRAYLIRGGQVRQITHDHNQASELLRSGIISEEEAAHSNVKNVLTRSLGGFPDVNVDLFDDIALLPGDLVLLCTDGLHRYLNDAALLHMTASGAPTEITRRLVSFARHAGGADNITALAVSVRPIEDASKATRPVRLPQRPPALSPETIKVPGAGFTLPRLNIPRLEAFMRLSPRNQLLAVGGILIAVLMIIMIGTLLSRGQRTQVTLGGNKTPTAKMFIAPTKGNATAAPQADGPIATWTIEVSPTPTPIPDTCVYKVKSGDFLSTIYTDLGKGYDSGATYTYYTNCNFQTGQCTGRSTIPPDKHNDTIINVGWYFVIDGVVGNACTDNGGRIIKIKP